MSDQINPHSFDQMTPECRRELASKGGKASGEKRRKKAAKRKKIEDAFIKAMIEDKLIEDLDEFLKWREMRKHKRNKTKEELLKNARSFRPDELNPVELLPVKSYDFRSCGDMTYVEK